MTTPRPALVLGLLAAAMACATAADKPAPPSCMSCGATCGLTPICVCTPGTKKQPEPEFSTECETFCVPGCSSRPWPLGHRDSSATCTSCCDDPAGCPGHVRVRKKLTKKTVDKEVATIERSVNYLCCRCARGPAATSCTTPPPATNTRWSDRLWSWWPWSPRS